MKISNDILQVVLGALKGDRKKEVFFLVDKDQQAKEEFRKIKNVWALAAAKKEMHEYQVEKLYLDFKDRQKRKEKTLSLRMSSFLKYAAVFIFAVGLSSLFFFIQSPDPHEKDFTARNTNIVTDNGQLSRIILPDSSVVWLNAGTKITYNSDFAVNNRAINLSGQAFFRVTKNKKIPMKVFCNNLQIKVLGTRFDVSAYPEDKNIRVVLESGKVEMSDSTGQLHDELKPGEMAEYDRTQKRISLEKVNVERFTSWKEGILIFRDDPMSEVIPKLQRRYNIDIEVTDPDIYKSIFTATIKNETLEEIFKSIGYACSVRYRIIREDYSNAKTKIILTAN